MSDRLTSLPKTKRIGIAAVHGGYELKEYLAGKLREAGHEVVDFGDGRPKADDDYPDFIVPLARAVDRRDDLGPPARFDVYYGMADNRIGVARLDLPELLPPGAAADSPETTRNILVLENSRS